MKRTSFLGVSSRRPCRSSLNHSTSDSQTGDLAKGLRTPREFDFGGYQDLITELLITGFCLHRTGEKDSWSPPTKPCTHQDPGERSCDPHKRLTQTYLCVCRSLQWRCGLTVTCYRVRTLSGAVYRRPFEGGQPLSSLPPPQFGQTTGREHSPAHQLKIGLKVY